MESDSLAFSGMVLFTTIIPETGACTNGGSSFFMVLDALTGARLNITFDFSGDSFVGADDKVKIDSNNDGIIDASDSAIAASGRRSNLGMSNTPSKVGDKIYVGGTDGLGNGNGLEVIGITPGEGSTGRLSWTQLK